jgi:hypothetical protein
MNATQGSGGCQMSMVSDVKPCHRIASVTKNKPFKIGVHLCLKCAEQIEKRFGTVEVNNHD